jgi:hypothetical protein
MKLIIAELDCIFISYDEPNAERNWADLSYKCMWAKRVHGVKGSDECHKEAARQSETEWFITVDADNIVDTNFFDLEVDLPIGAQAFSWPGVNIINGLRYGNGSLKVWRKDFVLNMKTHEASEGNKGQVDFCWEDGYRPMVSSYSITYPNATPFQAWRAGFREGVKMSLVDGVLPENPNPLKMFWHNLYRLKVWMSIGAHVENGIWAILGARHGCWKTNCTDWDYIDVRDFDKLAYIWKEVKNNDVVESVKHYGALLEKDFGLKVPLLDSSTSEFTVNIFKDQFQQAKEQIEWTIKRNNV